MGVYRDPFCELKATLKLLSKYPSLASNIRRLWFGGFHVSETTTYIFQVLSYCENLKSVTLPSIALHHGTVEDWSHLLGRRPGLEGISSLELLAVDLKETQRLSIANHTNHRALDHRIVDFSGLERLKIFGDTNHMPVMDDDLKKMARTATNLQEVHVTGMSSITIEGVMALVKASKNTLRVLEYSPVSKDGFEHPDIASTQRSEHYCELLTSCHRLENLSISVPSICPALFASESVNWKGEVQIRAAKLCTFDQDLASSTDAQDQFFNLLDRARSRMASQLARGTDLHIEIFICKS